MVPLQRRNARVKPLAPSSAAISIASIAKSSSSCRTIAKLTTATAQPGPRQVAQHRWKKRVGTDAYRRFEDAPS